MTDRFEFRSWDRPEQAGANPEKLDVLRQYLRELVGQGVYPGLVLIALRGGRLFVEESHGTCLIDGRTATPTSSTPLPLWSVSKGFSATLMAMLLEEGRIRLEDPVERYVEGFGARGKQGVTIGHLLTHAAGLPNAPYGPFTPPGAQRETLRVLCETEPEFAPGSRTSYHATSATFLMGAVAERVTGQSYETLLRERLLEPLGTEHASQRLDEGNVGRVAWVPVPQGGTLEERRETFAQVRRQYAAHPGAGVIASPRDVARLLLMHLADGQFNGRRILSREWVRRMRTVQFARERAAAQARGEWPAHEPWGLGWMVRDTLRDHWFGFGTGTSPAAFGHAGISTVIGIADPALDLAYVYATMDAPKVENDALTHRNRVASLLVESLEV